MFEVTEIKIMLDRLCREDPGNRLPEGSPIYEEPICGIASADDLLFEQFNQANIIGPLHSRPNRWLAGAASVVSYFLPFSTVVRESNLGEPPASLEWLHARFMGEEFNNRVRRFLVQELVARGGEAAAPLLQPEFEIDKDHFASNWSERHVAFASGLGSFGLHRGLITASGTAGRFGSVVTDLRLPPTSRAEGDPFQNCSYLREGSCGECIDRCPAGAISCDGMEKEKCRNYLFVTDPHRAERLQFGYRYSTCGKCQTGVPCEKSIP